MGSVIAGTAAGVAFGYALQRGQHCFHATFRGLLERRAALFKAWALAVALAAVGLTLVYALGPWDQLNRGLAFRPVPAVVGGLVFGVGMVVAASCVSGLFYKLGAGMAGAVVGLTGWGIGEVLAGGVDLPGPQLLAGGDAATIPGVLGLPRWAVAVPLAAVVVAVLGRTGDRHGDHPWQWGWPVAGVVLATVTVLSWVTAGLSGDSFGASTAGAVTSVVDGSPAWWRVAFLAAIIPGAALAARTAGGWWLRGEAGPRYAGLAAGGALLGAGARIAGGCNLGHGLSGVAQLNVSSFVVVASMVAGVALARAVQVRLRGPRRSAPRPAGPPYR